MRYTELLFGLVTFTGFLVVIGAECKNDLEVYCNATGISQQELEDEANSAGVTSKQLLEIIKCEKPIFDVDIDRNVTSEIEKNMSSIFSHYGDDDVLGFILSSSFSDVNESVVNRDILSSNVSEAKATILALKTGDDETNTIAVGGGGGEEEDGDLGRFITVPARIPVSGDTGNKYGTKFSGASDGFKGFEKNKLHRKCTESDLDEADERINRSGLVRVVKGRGYYANKERGRKYFIVDSDGVKREYKVVKYLPRNRRSREGRPRRVRVLRRVIQPLIVTETGLPPQFEQGVGSFITPPVPPTTGLISGNTNNLVFPPGPCSMQNQGQQYNLQQNGELRGRMSDEHEYSDRRDNRYSGGNTLIGPMTVAVIVIILLVLCVIGGFCFCGTKGSGDNHRYVPIPPPPPPPPPHGNFSRHPPPRAPHAQYSGEQLGAKAPLVPQHPTSSNQSNQVFGYAIVPRV
ncbi:transmembrane protein [Cryptosporidium ryanae]|uniref:uncharacterized protein n=1 Tax=Cryptosporidium ryanae TaxID=515981 RepID=UPI00351A15B1|nr:transmembrane protein [Cryptosporidium ryanae]